MKWLTVPLLFVACAALPQSAKVGKWLDTTEDTNSSKYFFTTGDGKVLLTEDYEVLKTHEICATLVGYFMEKSQLGRYNVNFKGLRTSSTFVFTTQYDAEKWAEKFCTPESLTSIRNGRGNMGRSY